MLQPHQPTAEQQLITARIVWAALTMSMLIYGFMLFTTGKITRLEELTSPSMIQSLALMANVIVLGVFWFLKNKVQTQTDFPKKFPLYILCWALNESVVIFGFVAVFATDDGNAFLYITNLLVGLTSNAFCFPKK